MSRNILPEPPEELKQLSHTLAKHIREKLGTDGMIPNGLYYWRLR